jgi:chromosomal replication initiator protein
MNDYTKLWESALVEIETAVSEANFSTWFKGTFILKHDEGTIYLGVPNSFTRDWLYKKYHPVILRTLRKMNEAVRSLEYIITKDAEKKKVEEKRKIQATPTISMPLQDFYVNKDDNLNPRYTFESFVVGPYNELAHAASRTVVKTPGHAYNPLFIYGNTGHGKTHLIQAVGNHIKKEHPRRKSFILPLKSLDQSI